MIIGIILPGLWIGKSSYTYSFVPVIESVFHSYFQILSFVSLYTMFSELPLFPDLFMY
jgi:hypothetical protein